LAFLAAQDGWRPSGPFLLLFFRGKILFIVTEWYFYGLFINFFRLSTQSVVKNFWIVVDK